MQFRDLEPHELKYADRDILAERLAALQKERAEWKRDALESADSKPITAENEARP